MEEKWIELNGLFDLADRLSPLACALMATLGIAVIIYLIFYDWAIKKKREYLGRIEDLEEQNSKKDAQIQRLALQNCNMAYELNGAKDEVRTANARAKESDKRADTMAREADKYRKQAENVA